MREWRPVHNRFDQFVKRLARKGFSPGGRVETEAEVTPDARRIDVWFVPFPGRAHKVLAPLGLFGRMGQASCTLEPHHSTPSGNQVADCFAKHRLFCCELARRKPSPPMPTQWIISSGRPSAALIGLNFRKSRLGPGIYDGPALMRTKLVVVNELPRTRDTLLVRLMGAGRTLQRAIANVRALPPDAPERRLALPILVRLRLEIPADPAKQTTIDREFLMTTQEIDKYLEQLHKEGLQKGLQEGRQVGREEGLQEGLQEGRKVGRDEGLQKGLQEGRKVGRDEGFAQAVLAAYRVRFGAPPAALVAAVERASDHAALLRWLEMVTTQSAEDVAAALRRPTTTKRARAPRTLNRLGASTRRASTSR
jgi:hypothetical protein